jgi:hypothetical protein
VAHRQPRPEITHLRRQGAIYHSSRFGLLSPMRAFAIRDIPIERPQYAHPRIHDRPSAPRGQDQSFSGGLPFGCHVLGLWKLDDIVPRGLERHKLATAGQRYRIVESLLPAFVSLPIGTTTLRRMAANLIRRR